MASGYEGGVGGAAARGGPLAVLGDAAFLACSWTWCIGMYLPAILMRDYGVWSFVVFGLPNCVGAAALAWWIRSPEASREFVATHAGAVRWFSFVTIAFQWFFGAWLLRNLGLSAWTLGAIAAGAAVYLSVPLRLMEDKSRRIVSVLVWLVSAGLLVAWAVMNPGDATLAGMPTPLLNDATFANHPGGHLAPLAAVCMLGFSMSPLLDGTFHLMLQRSASPRAAFGLGFLVLFAAMIVGTLFYGAALVRDGAGTGVSISPAGVAWLVVFHMAIQLAFTLASHERTVSQELAGLSQGHGRTPAMAVPVATVVGVVLALGATMISGNLAAQPAIQPGNVVLPTLTNTEFVYRGFMTFYGAIVPLYVLGCAMPWRGRSPGVSPNRLIVLGLALLVVVPTFYMGFVMRWSAGLWIGVATIVLAGTMAGMAPGPGDGAGSAGAK
jgi:hypothetical protein